MSNIQSAMTALFAKHRIVFWYDDRRKMRQELETLLLPGIETIELTNNEFTIKNPIPCEQPTQKFLIYHSDPTGFSMA